MRDESIARNYAEALFDLGVRDESAEQFGDGLELVARLFAEEADFRLFLETPRVERAKKKELLREVFQEVLPVPVLNFLLLVIDKRRQRLVGNIAEEYRGLLDEKLGRARVEVTIARDPDEGEAARIKEHLSRVLGVEAVPQLAVRPEIIGGIVFRSGDTIFDGSIRRRLERMKRELLSADVSPDT